MAHHKGTDAAMADEQPTGATPGTQNETTEDQQDDTPAGLSDAGKEALRKERDARREAAKRAKAAEDELATLKQAKADADAAKAKALAEIDAANRKRIEDGLADIPDEFKAFDPGPDAAIETRLAWFEKAVEQTGKRDSRTLTFPKTPTPRTGGKPEVKSLVSASSA
jgi:hypothetical protein